MRQTNFLLPMSFNVMYLGEYDVYVCDVTLSVYPHRTSLKNMPGHHGQAYFSSLSGVDIHSA